MRTSWLLLGYYFYFSLADFAFHYFLPFPVSVDVPYVPLYFYVILDNWL